MEKQRLLFLLLFLLGFSFSFLSRLVPLLFPISRGDRFGKEEGGGELRFEVILPLSSLHGFSSLSELLR